MSIICPHVCDPPGLQVQQMQQPQAPFMNEGGVGGQSVQSVPNPSYPSSIRPSSGPVYSSGSMTSAGNQVKQSVLLCVCSQIQEKSYF